MKQKTTKKRNEQRKLDSNKDKKKNCLACHKPLVDSFNYPYCSTKCRFLDLTI